MTAVIRSDRVTVQWRDLAIRLNVADDVVADIDQAEIPLSNSEKCFMILTDWRDKEPRASVKALQRHLTSMRCDMVASK